MGHSELPLAFASKRVSGQNRSSENRGVKLDVYGKRLTAKIKPFAVCLQLSVQWNQNIRICSE